MTGRERRELARVLRRVLAVTDARRDVGLRDLLAAYAAGLEGATP